MDRRREPILLSAPTMQPVSMHQRELEDLVTRQDDYLASLKADGVRYMLLLTKRAPTRHTGGGGHNNNNDAGDLLEYVALMFDRAMAVFEVSVWAPVPFFELGCLFDGELVEAIAPSGELQKGLTYLAFDTLVFRGEMMHQVDYENRLRIVESVFDVGGALPNESTEEGKDNRSMSLTEAENFVALHGKVVPMMHDVELRFRSKKFAPLSELVDLWQHRASAGFKEDGLMFVPRTTVNSVRGDNEGESGKHEYKYGKNTKMYKWKQEHTVDVAFERKMEPGPHHIPALGHDSTRLWKVMLWDGAARKSVCASDSANPVLRVPHGARNDSFAPITCVLHDSPCLDALDCGGSGVEQKKTSAALGVVECTMEVDLEGGLLKLFPVRLRHDKLHANSIATINSTMLNVLRHITLETIIQRLEQHETMETMETMETIENNGKQLKTVENN